MMNLAALIPSLVDAFGDQNVVNRLKGISASTKVSEKRTNV
jgi:hypothetical protein